MTATKRRRPRNGCRPPPPRSATCTGCPPPPRPVDRRGPARPVVAFSIASPYFLTQANWLNTTSTATEVLLLAVGETFVICTGGIDLSVGAVLGCSGMVGAWVMAHWFAVTSGPDLLSVTVGFAAAVLAGGAFGAVNGLLVTRAAVPPFVVTLGTLGIATGLGNLLDNGQEISNIPGSVTTFGNTNLGGWVPFRCGDRGRDHPLVRGGARQDPVRRLHAEHRRQPGGGVRAGINDRRHLFKVYLIWRLCWPGWRASW